MNVSARRRPRLNLVNQSNDEEYSRSHRPDHSIIILTALLMVIGLVVIYSISPALSASQHVSQARLITKQFIDIGLGVLAFTIATKFPLPRMFSLAKPLIVAAIIGSIIVMFTPINEAYPAHRWIRFGNFSFQVVELIKFALLIWLAAFLAKRWRWGQIHDFHATLKPLLLVMFVTGLVIAKFQSDFGSAAVVVSMMFLMAYAVGIPLKRIAIIAVTIALLAGLAVSTSPYRRERIASFLNPQASCQDINYHACQSITAVGSGGLLGQGLGYGTASYGYAPEPSNDSIFAIMGEKFGFIGSTMIIVIYGLYIARLKNIIERSANQAYRLVVVGVLAWLSTQMIINVGGMIGILPIKGITLPLISQGGTSLVFLAAALGLVYQISRYTSYNATQPKEPLGYETKNNNLGGRRLRRAYSPAFAPRSRT